MANKEKMERRIGRRSIFAVKINYKVSLLVGRDYLMKLSNLSPAPLKSMVNCLSVSPVAPGVKLIVKKFGSLEEELLLFPKAVTCRVDLPDSNVARLKNGSMSCGLRTLPCKSFFICAKV